MYIPYIIVYNILGECLKGIYFPNKIGIQKRETLLKNRCKPPKWIDPVGQNPGTIWYL